MVVNDAMCNPSIRVTTSNLNENLQRSSHFDSTKKSTSTTYNNIIPHDHTIDTSTDSHTHAQPIDVTALQTSSSPRGRPSRRGIRTSYDRIQQQNIGH